MWWLLVACMWGVSGGCGWGEVELTSLCFKGCLIYVWLWIWLL